MSSRRLRRFFTHLSNLKPGETLSLSPAESDHMRKVLRLKSGDSCLILNPEGVEAEALIEDLKGPARLKIQHLGSRKQFAKPILFIYSGLIQRGKMDDLIRQLQELGAGGFFPLETDRTVLKMVPEAKERVCQRWEKIIQEAAKQSGNSFLMHCGIPESLEKAVGDIPLSESVICFHPQGELSFKNWASQFTNAARLHLFFGPEGGFSPQEISLFKARDAQIVKLTESTLKADTAILGVVSALRFLNS